MTVGIECTSSQTYRLMISIQTKDSRWRWFQHCHLVFLGFVRSDRNSWILGCYIRYDSRKAKIKRGWRICWWHLIQIGFAHALDSIETQGGLDCCSKDDKTECRISSEVQDGLYIHNLSSVDISGGYSPSCFFISMLWVILIISLHRTYHLSLLAMTCLQSRLQMWMYLSLLANKYINWVYDEDWA